MPEKSNIKKWPLHDRPREKLLKNGPSSLTNTELIAILLGSGTVGKSAVDISREIMTKFITFSNMSNAEASAWKDIKGLGPAKLSHILAALEVGRRFREDKMTAEKIKITSAEDAAAIFTPRMKGLKREVFEIMFLDSNNAIIEVQQMTCGTVDQAYPIIREIAHAALQKYAKSIICAHNHPSGNIEPSNDDIRFTNKLNAAMELIGVDLLDHIVICDMNCFSIGDKK